MTARCAACGRRLRNPSPTGYGPVCARRLNPPPRRATIPPPAPADAPIPGQTALPLIDHQPSLWSA